MVSGLVEGAKIGHMELDDYSAHNCVSLLDWWSFVAED